MICGCRESEFADIDPRADNSQLHTAAEVTAPRRTTNNFDEAHYADDLRSAFSGVPRLRHTWIDRYMKMLVVGESGQGAPDETRSKLFKSIEPRSLLSFMCLVDGWAAPLPL